ncbi:MAG: hypothetical protein HQL56_15610 [Magnetococcales bacterium]|nr:hypothetical protein [Magnetococcales bacterium]
MSITRTAKDKLVTERAPPSLKVLRRLAMVALFLGLASALGLWLGVTWLESGFEGSYRDIVVQLAWRQNRLLPLVVGAALILALLAGMVTALVALYSTFRVAGTLHRFTLKLQNAAMESHRIEGDPSDREEALQAQYQEFLHALQSVQTHYDEASYLVDIAQRQLTLPDKNLHGGLDGTLQALRRRLGDDP